MLKNDTDIVPYEAPLTILDSKSTVCMANNGMDIKHTRHIARRVHFLRDGKNVNFTRLTSVREVCNW